MVTEKDCRNVYFQLKQIKKSNGKKPLYVKNITYLSFLVMDSYNKLNIKEVERLKFYKSLFILTETLTIISQNIDHYFLNHIYFFGPTIYKCLKASLGTVIDSVEKPIGDTYSRSPVYIKDETALKKRIEETDIELRNQVLYIVRLLEPFNGNQLTNIAYMLLQNSPDINSPDVIHHQFKTIEIIKEDIIKHSLLINFVNLPKKDEYYCAYEIDELSTISLNSGDIEFFDNRNIECLKNGTVNPLIVYFGIFILTFNNVSLGEGFHNLKKLLSCRILYNRQYKKKYNYNYEEQKISAKKSIKYCMDELIFLNLISKDKKLPLYNIIKFDDINYSINFTDLCTQLLPLRKYVESLNKSFKDMGVH